jgi:CHAT domain-containing protein/tetratricopeptide (TPR) repeat protein
MFSPRLLKLELKMKIRLLLTLISLFFTSGLNAQSAEDFLEKAKTAFNKYEFDQSIVLAKKALDQSKPGSKERLLSLDILSNNYLVKEDLDNAQKYISDWLQTVETSFPDSLNLIAKVHLASGELAALGRDFEKAIKEYSKITRMQMEGQVPLSKRLVKVYSEIGKCYARMGNHDKAEENFKLSLELVKSVVGEQPSQELSVAYNNLAISCFKKANYYKAIEYFKQTIYIKEELGMKGTVDIAEEYVNVASVSLFSKDYETAETYFDKAEKIYLEKGVERPLIPLYGNKGILYRRKKQYDKAIAAHKKGLELSLKHYGEIHPEVAHRYANIGTVYFYLENYEKANEYYQKALDIRIKLFPSGKHPELSRAYWNLADAAFELKEYNHCLNLLKKAWAANSLDAPDLDPYKDPLFYVQNYKQLGIFELDLILALKSKAHHALYLRNQKILDLKLAHESLYSLIWFLEQETKTFLNDSDKFTNYANINIYYRRLIQLSFELYQATNAQSYIDLAFEHAEGGKSMLLMEVIQSSNALEFGELPDSLVARGAELETTVAKLEGNLLLRSNQAVDVEQKQEAELALFNAKEELGAFVENIEAQYPRYHKAKYQDRQNSLLQIKTEVLEAETALIEYVFADSVFYVFVLQKNAELLMFRESLDSSDAKNLETYVEELTALPESKDWEEAPLMQMASQAEILYQRLVADVIKALNPEISRLVIVPDGVLSYLPFELLLTKKAEDSNLQDWPYLIRDYSIAYSYSASLLLENQRAAARLNNRKANFLAMAPNYSMNKSGNNQLRANLKDLPAALKEVQQLEQAYRGIYLFDSSATEQNFKEMLGQASILHFAMHGLLDNKEPLISSLVFSSTADTSEDNFLYAYEISKLKLETQLVVLSACETGVGMWQNGEGLLSLARSFMYAGTPSLLVSLWQVNDESTSVLMQYYYKALAKGKPKDLALQEAKLKYLEQAEGIIAHPTFWAGFIQLGDRSAIKIPQRTKYLYWAIGLLVLLGGVFGGYFFIKKSRK